MMEEEGCPRCLMGNFPNMPGELCDECREEVEEAAANPSPTATAV